MVLFLEANRISIDFALIRYLKGKSTVFFNHVMFPIKVNMPGGNDHYKKKYTATDLVI